MDDTQDRDTIFKHLIADLAGEIGSRAAANFSKAREEGGPRGAAAEVVTYSRFYEEIAEHITLEEEDFVTQLFEAFEHLWLHTKVTLIFAAVFYKFLFLSDSVDPERRDKYNSVLITGMKHLFLSDLHTESKRFKSLYTFLSEEVVLSDVGLDKLSSRAQLECAKIVARFSLYYFGAEKVAQILSSFPSNLDYGANILDFFLTEIMGIIRKTKVEDVIILYLESLSRLNQLISFSMLSLVSTTRVQELLFSLSQPGGPHYPPRAVRSAARLAFSKIYPNGKYLRAIFKVLTSLLHPAYSLNAVILNSWLVVTTVLNNLFSTWPWQRAKTHLRKMARRMTKSD